MLKKLYAKFRTEGIDGVLNAVSRRVLRQPPQQLEYFANCKSFFLNRIGLEIGGPSDVFQQLGLIPIYPIAARIDNCNFCAQTIWEGIIEEGRTFDFAKGKAPGNQYIAEASDLRCIGDSSYDFVLSSHCIEHLANPLQGLAEWTRVLRQGGLLVLLIPHKDGTFDHRRPTTTLEHLIQDFERSTKECDMTHLEEILRFHDLSRDPAAGSFDSFRARSARNVDNRSLHHHVFDTRLAVQVVDYVGLEILAVEPLRPFHIIVIAKKADTNLSVDNKRFLGMDPMSSSRSPFSSDRLKHHDA